MVLSNRALSLFSCNKRSLNSPLASVLINGSFVSVGPRDKLLDWSQSLLHLGLHRSLLCICYSV